MAAAPQPQQQQQQVVLTKEFLADYEALCAEFDELAKDQFNGPQLNKLAQAFLARHRQYLEESLPYSVESRYPSLSAAERVEDDTRILAETPDDLVVPEWAKIIAQAWRRICQGSYLCVTFSQARLGEQKDRMEPVEFGRRAIRYDPNNFLTVCYFTVSLGWYLDTMGGGPKERTLVARTFNEAIGRAHRLDPKHPIPVQLLGRFYFNVAQLSWLERTVANSLLGGKLEGSYKEAERQFLECKELGGEWLSTGLYLARILHAQKRPLEEVKKWIDYGLSRPDEDPTCIVERQLLLDFRAKLKLAN